MSAPIIHITLGPTWGDREPTEAERESFEALLSERLEAAYPGRTLIIDDGDTLRCTLDSEYDETALGLVQDAWGDWCGGARTLGGAACEPTIHVRRTGPVYLGPVIQPGSVAPAGYDGTFEARGSAAEILRAYREWSCSGDRYYPLTGREYGYRYIIDFRIVPAIARALADAQGVSYWAVVGGVARLAAALRVGS